MRQCLIIMLIFCLSIQLCGCIKQAQNQETLSAVSTQDTTHLASEPSIVPQYSQKPMYSISLHPIETQEKAEDDTVIFHCKYQNISLILPEQEIADSVILDFLKRTDDIIEHSKIALSAAKQAYIPSDHWNPHLLQLIYTPARLDPAVLSLHGEKRSYTGGAHTAYSGESVNYDLLSGLPLRLSDILKENVNGDVLIQLVLSQLEDPTASYRPTLFTSYRETLSQHFHSDLSNYEDWYFSSVGLVFYFDPYEIGPFAEGIISVEIPYCLLTDILKDEYFPAESDHLAGNVKLIAFENANLDDFTQFAEVILDKDANKFLLFTDKAVTDVTLATVPNNKTEMNTKLDRVIFSAHTLTIGDAIMIEADLTKSALLLGYRTAGEHKEATIYSENGIVAID